MIRINQVDSKESNCTIKAPLRIMAGLLLSVLSGVLLTASFSPYNQWYFIFIAFVPMVFAQYRILPQQYSPWASGLTNMVWLALYFGPMFFFTEGAPFYMKLLPLIGLLLSLLTEKGFRRFHDLTGYRLLVIHGISNWIWFEFIRTLIPGLGTWGFVGYTLWSQRWLVFPTSLVGIYGLSLLVMLINYSVAIGGLHFWDNRFRLEKVIPVSKSLSRLYLIISLIFVVLWSGAGLILQAQRAESLQDNPEYRVVAIQPGLTEVAFNNPTMDSQERLNLMEELTLQTVEKTPDVIVWPELVLNFDPQLMHTQQLQKLAQTMNSYLILPYGLLENGEMRNELTLLTPAGSFEEIYSKTHPVFFAGERRGPNWGNFPVYQLSIGVLGPMICYDLNYTDVARIMKQKGAQMLVVPSNDWPGIVEKQNIHLVFRAIENNLPIVKAENAYSSVIVSAMGEIMEETVSYSPEKAIISSLITIGATKPTLYSRIGDVVGLVFFVLGFVMMILEGIVKKASKKINKN